MKLIFVVIFSLLFDVYVSLCFKIHNEFDKVLKLRIGENDVFAVVNSLKPGKSIELCNKVNNIRLEIKSQHNDLLASCGLKVKTEDKTKLCFSKTMGFRVKIIDDLTNIYFGKENESKHKKNRLVRRILR